MTQIRKPSTPRPTQARSEHSRSPPESHLQCCTAQGYHPFLKLGLLTITGAFIISKILPVKKKLRDEKSLSCPHQETADSMSASPSVWGGFSELEWGCSLCNSSTKICKQSAYGSVDAPSAELPDNYQLWFFFFPPLKLISTARGFGFLQAPVARGPMLQPALFNYPLLFCPANVRSQRVTDALPQRRHPITEEDVGSHGDLGSNA